MAEAEKIAGMDRKEPSENQLFDLRDWGGERVSYDGKAIHTTCLRVHAGK